ncbi:hypothetical protein AWD60_001538 [Escherichia coli]|uniref:phage tail protein n=1 Tax=Escherichia coli TaxID=562 RepID=UPI0005439627|nr:phage tail protein [Escherichia coli]EEV5604864.1 hypothetical protein [Escherichia coli]EEV9022329.1 hypothetical protein [Escherichia coli]EEW3232196.1 hypothetical protein [Escherichia coli]EEX1963059.1 hypothetical protein [Escherichia coli]EEY5871485.1 hypothetical protein [Escherichia coli]
MKIPSPPDITLPTWMNKGEPLTLAHSSRRYMEKIYSWLTWPLAQIDVDTCAEPLLNLLAYQRNITRFRGEPVSLFRLRVKHAFINACDSGEKAGFERIFRRLGIGEIKTLERQLQYDWDVILLRINDTQLSENNALMMQLIRQYGRTCRRYFFQVINQTTGYINGGEYGGEYRYHAADAHVMKNTIWLDITVHAASYSASVEQYIFTG